MYSIDKYVKSPLSLEEREIFLFDLIKKLDVESFQLFSEVLDLNEKSIYRIENLTRRTSSLIDITQSTLDAFEYLNNIEQKSYDYATKRYQLRSLLTAITTINTMLINTVFAIISFIILNGQNNKAFVKDLEAINKRYIQFDQDRLNTIMTTLENCTRIIYGKTNKMKNMIQTDTIENRLLIHANTYIAFYLDGSIESQGISSLPNLIKNTMIEILQKDLDSDNPNLLELLELAKNKKEQSLKLINQFI